MRVDTDKIKWLLENNTQYRVAKETGVSQSTLSSVINGTRKIENLTIEVGSKLTKYAEELMEQIKEKTKMMATRYETVKEIMDWESNDGQIEFFAHGETVRIPESDMIEELEYSIDEDGDLYNEFGTPSSSSDLVEAYLATYEKEVINQLVDLIDWEEIEAKCEASIIKQIEEDLEDDSEPIFREGRWDVYYQPNFTELYWVERGMAYDGSDRNAYVVAIVDDGEVDIRL